jgi:hypothetical protein
MTEALHHLIAQILQCQEMYERVMQHPNNTARLSLLSALSEKRLSLLGTPLALPTLQIAFLAT